VLPAGADPLRQEAQPVVVVFRAGYDGVNRELAPKFQELLCLGSVERQAERRRALATVPLQRLNIKYLTAGVALPVF